MVDRVRPKAFQQPAAQCMVESPKRSTTFSYMHHHRTCFVLRPEELNKVHPSLSENTVTPMVDYHFPLKHFIQMVPHFQTHSPINGTQVVSG